jgi:hypothetical protein
VLNRTTSRPVGFVHLRALIYQPLRDPAVRQVAARPRMSGLDRRCFPELGQQPLLANKGPQHMQCKPYFQRPDRLVRRSLCRLAQDLQRQVDEDVPMSLTPCSALAKGAGADPNGLVTRLGSATWHTPAAFTPPLTLTLLSRKQSEIGCRQFQMASSSGLMTIDPTGRPP